MKKIMLSLISTVVIGLTTLASVTTVTVKDSISTDTHWTCGQQYLLKGYVYVTAGATLTIDAGVIIRGDKQTKGSLIIERGAKIMAVGTATSPIVFTSNEAIGNRSYGDWGGVILCGKAPNNWASGVAQVEGGPRSLYGGTDPNDNSGVMQYVRIEFPGIAFSPNNEINGLTFCSVGAGTTIDHIQVYQSGDDSYEWFGGTVNTKYLIAASGWDDDFDTDNGYSGMNQYGIGLRDPFVADQSGSKAWESDSYQSGTKSGMNGDTSGLTKCVFANYTAIGPLVSPSSTAYDPQFVAAAHIRRGSAISILNSLLVGYPAGVLIDEADTASFGSTIANIASGASQFKNNAIAGIPSNKEMFFVYNGARSITPTNTMGDTAKFFGRIANAPTGPWAMFNDPANSDKLFATQSNGLRLQNPFNLTNPDFTPTSTSPICYNSKSLPAYISGDPFANGKKYPYDPSKAINTDTSNLFANYNAPDLKPTNTSNKVTNPFFAPENHIGAMNFGQAKWFAGWTNFDPNNTDYNVACTANAVQNYEADKLYLRVSPNPAKTEAVIGYTLAETGNIEITLLDVLGNKIKTIYSQSSESLGTYTYKFQTADLNAGIYFINVQSTKSNQTIKLVVAN